MKKLVVFVLLCVFINQFAKAQEFADFTITNPNEGIGTFNKATLPDFSWNVTGSLNQDVQIKDSETFDDGNQFEQKFGQANNTENLRIQNVANGNSTSGQKITSKSTLTINFEKFAPANCWGFCLVDIDVENAIISATDIEGNKVTPDIINRWLIELFDTNLGEDGVNICKWDSANSALLGSDTPDGYTEYNDLVIGGMSSDEAGSAYFFPDIPIKSLSVVLENLQENYATSYHFYVASEDINTFIPDDNFEQVLIDLGYDTGTLNDLVLTANIIGVTNLQVSDKNIVDLTGVEDFTALTDLRSSINKLTELDVSKNLGLEILKIDFNQLTEIDVSKNTKLWSFSTSDNQLSELDVSNNAALKNLYCSNNPLNEINLTNNTELTILYCRNNNLTEIDLSNNTKLEYLSFNDNLLTTIDLTKNKALKNLQTWGNQLTELDLSANNALFDLRCQNNQLLNLDLSNNPLLQNLYCQDNQVSNLNLNNHTDLYYLDCSNNQLATLNLSNVPELHYTNCSGNQLETISLLESGIRYLDCSSNQLTSIDLLNNTGLGYLDCSNNRLSELDLSNIEDIFVLLCDSNKLSSLDVSLNDTLYLLDCSYNQLTELNIQNGNNDQLTGETTPLYPIYYNPDPGFHASNNPDLLCIQVDDSTASADFPDWQKDSIAVYSEDCARVKVIQVDGVAIEGFNSDVFVYDIELQGGTTGFPVVTATLLSSAITVNVIQVDEVPGSAKVEIIRDGITTYVYTINFSYPTNLRNEHVETGGLTLYPNPAREKVSIHISDDMRGAILLRLLNSSGKTVIEKQLSAVTNNIELDVSDLRDGIYFCKILSDEKYMSGKIIINK